MLSTLLSCVFVLTLPSLAKDVQAIHTSLELQCPPCAKIHCTPRRANRLSCKGGITRGICNCCPVCAKIESEDCGGDHDYLGKCDHRLYCRPNANRVIADYVAFTMTGVGKKRPEGKCTKGGRIIMCVVVTCCSSEASDNCMLSIAQMPCSLKVMQNYCSYTVPLGVFHRCASCV